jgi:hypothetical protein
MAEFSKTERRTLRELASTVHECEAHRMLEQLDATFARWRQDEIQSSELIDAIHEFHQHQSRELWSIYNSLREWHVVARGVALGFIAAERVAPPLLAKLQSLIGFYGELGVEADQSEDGEGDAA